jgi:PAS domain S-box-containing protein
METIAFDGSQAPGGVVGHYTYEVAEDAWSWSEGVYALHGYAADEVPASTEVLLRHKHPDDRSRAAAVLEDAARDGGPYSCYHRILTRDGSVRSVMSVGHGITGSDGRVERVEGFFVDLTDARRTETEADVQVALALAAEHREVIDEAKGMVMLATGCDGDAAFACLRRYSQDANVKVRDLAHRLVDAVGAEFRGSDQVMSFLDGMVESPRPVAAG